MKPGLGQKVVWQCDATGLYIGETLADPDPMTPGFWLIPAGATDQPIPPKPWGDLWPLWVGHKWRMVDRNSDMP